MEKPGVRPPGAGDRRRHGRRPIGGVIVLAAALAVAAAACSSSSSSAGGSGTAGTAGSSGSSGGTSSAAAPPLAHYNVTVGNAAATYAEAPYVAATKDGALTAENITSKDVLLSSSNTLLAALVSGGVDFGVTDTFAVMSARQKGVPVVAVCGLYQGVPGLALVVTPSLIKSLGLTSGDVNGDLKKLKGQTIGVNAPTSTGGKILTGLEVSAGLGSTWVKEVSIASSDDVEALEHGEISGYFEDVPIPQESLANKSGAVAFTTATVPELADIQYDVLATSESFLKSNPQEVKQFLAGVAVGEKDLSEKQPAALQQISGIFNTGLPASVIDDSATAGVQTNCSMPASDWSHAAAVSNKFGLASGTLSGSAVTGSYQNGL